MFNLTKQEILVLGFIGFAAISGISINFFSKQSISLEERVNFKININKATKEELVKLEGIGPALAERIIKYRNFYGPFNRIEDIKKIYGIGDSKFNRIKNYLSVR